MKKHLSSRSIKWTSFPIYFIDVVDVYELEVGERPESFLYSLIVFCNKLAVAVALAVSAEFLNEFKQINHGVVSHRHWAKLSVTLEKMRAQRRRQTGSSSPGPYQLNSVSKADDDE
ncbi:hypothetical protein ACTXT7_008602 [Hymenolepis weldensis]